MGILDDVAQKRPFLIHHKDSKRPPRVLEATDAPRINGRFAPGRSANPGGRYRTPPELVDAFRRLTPLAVDVLSDILERYRAEDPNVKPGEAAKAAEIILNRGWGAAPQVVRHELADRDDTLALDPKGLSTDDLTALAQLLRSANAPPQLEAGAGADGGGPQTVTVTAGSSSGDASEE